MSKNAIEKGADKLYRLEKGTFNIELESGLHRGRTVLPEFFKRYGVPAGAKVLDVGCGIGAVVKGLNDAGFDAVGLEPGGRHHDAVSEKVLPLFTSDYLEKFPDERFDVVMSFGVIEHVGTVDGHDKLDQAFEAVRAAFYKQCMDLLRPGGTLIVFGPNKLFPFDLQHGPAQYGALKKLKQIFPQLRRLTIPWHRENFLVSWDDVNRHVMRISAADRTAYTPIYPRQRGFVGGRSVKTKFLLSVFHIYTGVVDLLPKFLAQLFHTHTLYVAKMDE